MSYKRVAMIFGLLFLFVSAYGQEQPTLLWRVSPELMSSAQFHDLEWQAKIRHFQLLKQ
jgi:hypothetical protein